MRTVRSRAWAVALLLCAVGVGGCADRNVTVSGRANARIYSGAVPLTIVNDSRWTVCYVQMAPSGAHDWGGDWLGPEEVIRPGIARDFGLRNPDLWSIRLVDCRHDVIAARRVFRIDGPTTIHVQAWFEGH